MAAFNCGLGAVASSRTSTWDSKNKMCCSGYSVVTTHWKNNLYPFLFSANIFISFCDLFSSFLFHLPKKNQSHKTTIFAGKCDI